MQGNRNVMPSDQYQNEGQTTHPINEIEREHARLDIAVKVVRNLVGQLESRLQHVLRDEPESSSLSNTKEAPDTPAMTKMGNDVRELTYITESSGRCIERLLRLLEL